MLPEDPNAYGWMIKAALYSAFAAFGGLMGHLFRSLDGAAPVTLYASCVKSLGAAFAGFLVFLLCNVLQLSEQWTGVIVGVFGWLGADVTIMVLEKQVLKKLGITWKGRQTSQPPKEPEDV